MTEFFSFVALYNYVAEATRKVGDALYWGIYNNPVTVFLVFWALLIVAFVIWLKRWLRKDKRGSDYKMAQRKAYLDRIFADMIGDGLSELYLNGKINAQEYRKHFKVFGTKHGLTDLMPRSTHKKAIEHRVRKNISSVKLLDEHGNPIQPSIPGPKPGEVTLPTRREPKRWVVIRKKLLPHKVA